MTDKALLEGYARYADDTNSAAELAALVPGVTLNEVEAALADPEKVAELEAYRALLQRQRKPQPGRVNKLTAMTLDVIEGHLTAGCDIDAALEIIKPLIRLTEVSERTRLAEREVDELKKLPVIHITIGRPAEKLTPQSADVIDVHAVQISTGAGGPL